MTLVCKFLLPQLQEKNIPHLGDKINFLWFLEHEAIPGGPDRGLGAVINTQLVEDMNHVALNSMRVIDCH
jgi:hypothetical protein